MALPLLAFACAVLAISGQGKTVDSQYAVSPSSISAEIEPADSKLMAKSASLLAKGASGRAALIRESRSQDPKRTQAARLIMLGAGEPSFVPILLEKLQLQPSLESGVADKTIERFPKESWPVLQRMARQGNPAAFYGIFRYKILGPPELLTLSKHPVAKVRANAINLLDDIPRLNEALDDPAEAVQRQAMSRLINYVNADPQPFMKDPRTHVRALVAEFAQPWTKKDFPGWVQLAEDPSPRVRKGAVLQLAPLGLEWGYGPWAKQGIAAVGKAIKNGPADVRTNAIYAVRSWLLKWPTIDQYWRPTEIQMANEIIRLPAFRDAVYKAIPSEDPNSGTQHLLGIQMAPAYQCLIYSQDPRALGVVKKTLATNAWTHAGWIESLGFLPGSKTVDYLFDLIDQAVSGPNPGDDVQQAYEAEQLYGFAVVSLKRLEIKDFHRALIHVNDKKEAVVYRVGIARMLASVGTEPIYQSLKALILEPTLPDWAKSNVIYSIADCSHPDVDAFLRTLEKESKSEVVRISATNALRIRTRREG